jgi:hypothetical protein
MGRLAEHHLRFPAHRLDRLLRVRPAFLPDRHDRGFVEHDALAANVDQRVRGAKVDREIIGKITAQESEHVRGLRPFRR